MSHQPRSAERPEKPATLDRRHAVAQAKLPQTPLKPHQVPRLDQRMKQADPRPLKLRQIGRFDRGLK
jgi:hypothetical protein